MIEETALPDVLSLTPRVFADGRGAFSETYSQANLEKFGISTAFVQDNQSWSKDIGGA